MPWTHPGAPKHQRVHSVGSLSLPPSGLNQASLTVSAVRSPGYHSHCERCEEPRVSQPHCERCEEPRVSKTMMGAQRLHWKKRGHGSSSLEYTGGFAFCAMTDAVT